MSHKTEVQTTLTDISYMQKALDKLGFTYETGDNLNCKIMDGSTVDVELKITGNGKKTYDYQVGFRKGEDGTYIGTGEFWGLKAPDGRSLTKELLNTEVTAASKEAELIDRLGKLGFDVANSNETKDYIEVTLERWT